MIRILISVLLFAGLAGPASAGEFLDLAYGILAAKAAKPATPATPVTPVTPVTPASDICDNCNGVGKVGDGRTMLTCPVCNGTGKKAKPGEAPPVVTPVDEPQDRVHYPTRSRWWSGCSGWRHLTVGQHAGLFDHEWLASLTNEEVQSLHSDHHEGRTKWEYVVRATKEKPADKPAPAKTQQSACPGGNCPTSSGRLFGRWLGR